MNSFDVHLPKFGQVVIPIGIVFGHYLSDKETISAVTNLGIWPFISMTNDYPYFFICFLFPFL